MHDLAYLIGQESLALDQLINTLNEELGALKAGMADALPEIVEKKNKILEGLARLDRKRGELLVTARCSADRAGLKKWAKDNERKPIVDDFLAKADEARELNRLSGQLISLRLQHTQSALETLVPNRSAQGLYGRSGKTSFSTGYRLIDSA